MTHNPKHSSKPIYAKQSRNLALMLCLGMLAGVLIWAKLRLVTDIPRSAYADPRETQQVEDQEDLNQSSHSQSSLEVDVQENARSDDEDDSYDSLDPSASDS
jgi:hypothetical protein